MKDCHSKVQDRALLCTASIKKTSICHFWNPPTIKPLLTDGPIKLEKVQLSVMVIVNMVIMMIISNQRNYNSYDNIKNNILNLP